MVVKVNFENGIAVINIVSMDTSERDALIQAALSAKQLLPSSNKMNAVLNLCMSATDAYTLEDPHNFLNNFSDYKPEYPNLDNKKKVIQKYDDNDKLYNKINTNDAEKLKKNATTGISNKQQLSISETLTKLFKDYDKAKAAYSEYSVLHNILLDILSDSDISDTDIDEINKKIQVCKSKKADVDHAYKVLMDFVRNI